jgi:hypothetical protein
VQLTISQDIVTIRSGFVVKFNNCFVVYLILNSMLKKLLKSVNIWLSYGQKYGGPFLTHSVVIGLWQADAETNRNSTAGQSLTH